MNVTADRFLEQLHRTASCPHLVIAGGTEEYYRKAIAEALKKKINAEFPEEELNGSAFQDRFSLVDLREAINSQSFFGGLNWVIVENPQFLAKDKKSADKTRNKTAKKGRGGQTLSPDQEFLEILSHIPENAYVLCLLDEVDKRTAFFKAISKLGPYVECEPLRWYQTKQLDGWLEAQAASYGARFDAGAKALIGEYVSASDEIPLLLLRQEIRKIALYSGRRKIWNAEDVRQMFSQLPQVSTYALGRAIEERSLTQALELLSAEKKEGDKRFPLMLYVVTNEVRTLTQVKAMMARGDRQEAIAAGLRKNPFIVRNIMASSRHFSTSRLQESLVALAALGMDSRNGGRTWSRLEEIVVKLLTEG